MLVRSVLLSIFALPAALIRGQQIPVIDGVIGGVPSSDASGAKTQKATVFIDANPTPGKLRVVEKSGVCGGYLFAGHTISESY